MRVVVLGCGYVGLELGRQLSAAGHDVVGVRRSSEGLDEVAAAGLEPARGDVTDPDSLRELPDADWLVFAASTGGGDAQAAERVFVGGLEAAITEYGSRADAPDRLVYASSTGVYGDHDGDWVDESTRVEPATDKTLVLAEAERAALTFADERGIDGTVVRFAGLYGPDRYRLERYLEGPVTEGYLNMVHRDDAAGAIAFLLEADAARGETVLVVDDEPVDKWEFADWLAERCGLPEPPKRTKAERLADDPPETVRRRVLTSKRCANARLRELGYELRYPTFREGYRDAVEEFRNSDFDRR